jgi:hypothetical protein
VFVVGGRAFTSIILQRNCHEFIAYENLVRKPAARGGRPTGPTASAPIAQAFPIVRRALKILADREVSPQTGLLKSTLLQLDSTFSERSYGASSFLDFAEKLSQAGLVQLKHSGRSVMVELNPGFADDGEQTPRVESVAEPRDIVSGVSPFSSTAPAERPAGASAMSEPPPPQAGDNAEGVRLAGQILARASRWPMYIRNAKQILRGSGFDERRYGFGGLIDLLRGCQRENFIRLERDRRGGLRLFQGPALLRPGAAAMAPGLPVDLPADDGAEMEAAVMIEAVVVPDTDGFEDAEPIDVQPVAVVDTTAELLGRAKPRRPRARASGMPHGLEADGNRPAAARGTRKTASRKVQGAGGRRNRARKTTAEGGES